MSCSFPGFFYKNMRSISKWASNGSKDDFEIFDLEYLKETKGFSIYIWRADKDGQ